ncbi:hypothetical protein FB45DRAFT_35442, partial [Roridomyces roridus]
SLRTTTTLHDRADYSRESTLQHLPFFSPPALAFKLLSPVTSSRLQLRGSSQVEVGWWWGSFSRLTIALRPGDQRFRKLNLPLLLHPQRISVAASPNDFDFQTDANEAKNKNREGLRSRHTGRRHFHGLSSFEFGPHATRDQDRGTGCHRRGGYRGDVDARRMAHRRCLARMWLVSTACL